MFNQITNLNEVKKNYEDVVPCSSSYNSIHTSNGLKRSISSLSIDKLSFHHFPSNHRIGSNQTDSLLVHRNSSHLNLKKRRLSETIVSNSDLTKFREEVCKKHSEAKYLEIEKVPGIGPAYAKRLNANRIFILNDLIDIFKKECLENEFEFQRKLKNMTQMRTDSVEKVTCFVDKFLNKN